VNTRPLASLGDLIRAAVTLRAADEPTVRAIVHLLGDDLSEPPLVEEGSRGTARDDRLEQETGTAAKSQPPGRLTPRTGQALGPPLRLVVTAATRIPGGSDAWKVGPGLEPFRCDTHLKGVARHDPLFRPLWVRPLLAASLATQTTWGSINVTLLVDTLARGRPVVRLPRLPTPSLHRGVQVLVDRGEGMQPFARDQDELVGTIRGVVGGDATAVLEFRGCPTWGAGTGPVWDWGPYTPPGPRTPVLILSDLGIARHTACGERASVGEWLAFARGLARQPCPVIAFVPYPEDRWPRRIAREVVLVPWDRSTSIQTVRRAVGRILEALR
jgi:hypothetical protein